MQMVEYSVDPWAEMMAARSAGSMAEWRVEM